MNKNKHTQTSDDLRPEYDMRELLKGSLRGKHYNAMRAGYAITIHKANGTTEIEQVIPTAGAIILAPDVQVYFPDSESVNQTLRSLIRLVPSKRKSSPERWQSVRRNRPDSGEIAIKTKRALTDWVLEALKALGGTGMPEQVGKYIWEHHQAELESSDSLFYAWQYDIRWAIKKLRDAGKIAPGEQNRTGKPWVLVQPGRTRR